MSDRVHFDFVGDIKVNDRVVYFNSILNRDTIILVDDIIDGKLIDPKTYPGLAISGRYVIYDAEKNLVNSPTLMPINRVRALSKDDEIIYLMHSESDKIDDFEWDNLDELLEVLHSIKLKYTYIYEVLNMSGLIHKK